jgi:hypothetical protein
LGPRSGFVRSSRRITTGPLPGRVSRPRAPGRSLRNLCVPGPLPIVAGVCPSAILDPPAPASARAALPDPAASSPSRPACSTSVRIAPGRGGRSGRTIQPSRRPANRGPASPTRGPPGPPTTPR